MPVQTKCAGRRNAPLGHFQNIVNAPKKQTHYGSAGMRQTHSSLSPLPAICPKVSLFVMSIESVRAFFAAHAPDLEVLETETSSATVAEAAATHSVDPDQIAKTIAVKIGDDVALIVTAGMRRLENRKFKDRFGIKPRMLDAESVVALTSHPVGGVCPFGLPAPVKVYCDVSLKNYEIVVPAAGGTNAAVKVAPERMAALVNAEWADLCQ